MKSWGRSMIVGVTVAYASHLKNGVQEVHTAQYVLHFWCGQSYGIIWLTETDWKRIIDIFCLKHKSHQNAVLFLAETKAKKYNFWSETKKNENKKSA